MVARVTSWSGRRLHFVGIGGAGMSGLALVARRLGADVSGSDRAESAYSERLRAAGIEPAIGHDTAQVPDGAEVVVSTAIPASNPELVRARELGLRVLHRGDLLAEVALLKRSIAVSGAHGKTTTTGMLAHVLRATGRDPAFVMGGELRESGTNAAWGDGDWIVVEADESDRSFLKLRQSSRTSNSTTTRRTRRRAS
jgi:UDP-N-acetylmuramate--alanine ligase